MNRPSTVTATVPRRADGRRVFHPVSRWAEHVETAVSAAPELSDGARGRLLNLMAGGE